jgi:hypothetical protein
MENSTSVNRSTLILTVSTLSSALLGTLTPHAGAGVHLRRRQAVLRA